MLKLSDCIVNENSLKSYIYIMNVVNDKKCCIIIPIYNESPSENEVKSIKRNTSVLKEHDIYVVCPIGLDTGGYRELGLSSFIEFDDRFFRSNKSYSRLILSEQFYKPFLEYEYMLIAQTDTYILNTEYSLGQFIDIGYDYWGAPWQRGPFDEPYGVRELVKSVFVPRPRDLHVGNGGFSLRRVCSTYDLVKKNNMYIKYIWRLNEDLFFAKCARSSREIYTAASINEASLFALETNMQEEIEKGNVPFAIHAWEKYLSKDTIEELIK